jgi:uncharacterized membrane protein
MHPDASSGDRWRRAAAFALAALAVLELAWEWKLAPLRPGGSWLVLKAVPVAWAALAVSLHRPRAVTIAALVLLACFTEAVVRAATEPAWPSRIALVAGAASVLAFVALARATRRAR